MVNRLSLTGALLNRLGRQIQTMLFTGRCVVCAGQSQRHVDICQPCEDELPWSGTVCYRCALPLATDTAQETIRQQSITRNTPSDRYRACGYDAHQCNTGESSPFQHTQRVLPQTTAQSIQPGTRQGLTQDLRSYTRDDANSGHSDAEHDKQPTRLLCEQCVQSPPVFQRALTPWMYEPPIAQLISAFKYQRRYSYGRVLAETAIPRIVSAYSQSPVPDYLIPTPLHWQRQLKRGFNQSEHISCYLSNHLAIPVFHGLKRTRATPAQQSLDYQQRQQSIRGAFSLKQPHKLIDCRIAIIDDVLTTCATANELSRCLLGAGVSEVHVWCLARTAIPL